MNYNSSLAHSKSNLIFTILFLSSRRSTALVKAVTEREALYTLQHEEKIKRDLLASAQDSLEVSQRKFDKLRVDEKSLQERKVGTEAKAKSINQELGNIRKEHAELQSRRIQTRYDFNFPSSFSLI